MDFDFSQHQPKLIPTQEYEFLELAGSPTLICRPMTSQNPAATNALMRARIGRSTTAEQIRTNDAKLAKLLAAHVVTGWRNVTNKAGNAVPYSAKACSEFLIAIPDYMLAELVTFVGNPRNFVEDAPSPEEVDETAGK